MSASLYQRLGGAAAVTAVIDDAVDRHAANPALAALFSGRDLPQLKVIGVQCLSAGTGGPGYTLVPDEIWPHLGMRFTPAQWQAVAGDITEALHELGIGAVEATEVLSLFVSPSCARNDSRTRRP